MHNYDFTDELYIDVNSSDEELDAYIERERAAFRAEWFRYTAEDYD